MRFTVDEWIPNKLILIVENIFNLLVMCKNQYFYS